MINSSAWSKGVQDLSPEGQVLPGGLFERKNECGPGGSLVPSFEVAFVYSLPPCIKDI